VTSNPYDELPYRSVPVVWSAPERLALASLLHGGPRAPLERYRALELGCGTAANLLPLAYFRPHATFVGVDCAASAIATAEARRAALGLGNVELVEAEFLAAGDRVAGPFDFILAHGVFSWIPDDQRDAMLALCARHLAPGGLLYLNYNARPGWNIRGMVRELLRAQTAPRGGLRARAAAAQELAATVAASFAASTEHPYSALMAREFRLVAEGEISYVAHEYLADDNHAYWRSEFLALARAHGLACITDADFDQDSGRIPADLSEQLAAAPGFAPPVEDAVDLLCYRQLHSPVLTRAPWAPRPATLEELAGLLVASPLTPVAPEGSTARRFRHPAGPEVNVKTDAMATALVRLQAAWPRGARVGDLFADVAGVADDLRLLHRYRMVDLRLVEPAPVPPGPLHAVERGWGVEVTTPYHGREPV
jgi:SAM-dependent methyltransferase